jgi:membrane protein YdbS with pleckstrin-like domain
MKLIIKIIFFLIIAGIGIGTYYHFEGELRRSETIIGVSVLAMVFILMPLFLIHRWKGKKLSDYTLTKENLDKMRDQKKE